MIDYSTFYKKIKNTKLDSWINSLPEKISYNMRVERYSQIPEWEAALELIPKIIPDKIELKDDLMVSGKAPDFLQERLMAFHPWRKGPFSIYNTIINTEWRSDWKWNRLISHIEPLEDRIILDVGAGNGYYIWRMVGANAKLAIGIDPQPLYIYQFFAIKNLIGDIDNGWVLPLAMEDIPLSSNIFDTCFSMGVLYHRRDPIRHLKNLYSVLSHRGELVLETLIINESYGDYLIPRERYAKMPNVWIIPSVKTLKKWLKNCNFKNIRIIDITPTSFNEQRSTSWMKFESLKDFIDPNNAQKTIEGYPSPVRAIVLAKK